MDRMSPMDASFLHLENDTTPMHIGGVRIFAGPPPPFAQLRAMLAGKLDRTPRYRQKVRFVPLAAGSPVWVDDPHFNLDYHVRHTAIPAPGGEDQLRRLAGRVFSQHLDRNRPLWEIWVVEGLDEDRWALLFKVHHCMVDGVAATDLMSVMFSDDPSAAPPAPWSPGPEPSDAQVLLRALAHRAVSPRAQVGTTAGSTSASPATATAPATSTCSPPASATGCRTCCAPPRERRRTLRHAADPRAGPTRDDAVSGPWRPPSTPGGSPWPRRRRRAGCAGPRRAGGTRARARSRSAGPSRARVGRAR